MDNEITHGLALICLFTTVSISIPFILLTLGIEDKRITWCMWLYFNMGICMVYL